MLSISANITPLAVRQHVIEDEDDIFALSADDGANLIDDNDEIMETYDGNPS